MGQPVSRVLCNLTSTITMTEELGCLSNLNVHGRFEWFCNVRTLPNYIQHMGRDYTNVLNDPCTAEHQRDQREGNGSYCVRARNRFGNHFSSFVEVRFGTC